MNSGTKKRTIGEISEEEEKGVEYFKSELIPVQKELIECQQQLLEHTKKPPVDKIEKEKIVATVEEIKRFFTSFSRQHARRAREMIDECNNGCSWSDAHWCSEGYADVVEDCVESGYGEKLSMIAEFVRKL